MLKKILKWCNHNHWYVIGFFVMAATTIYLFGCQSQVPSLLDETKKVGRVELQAELNYLIGKAESRVSELDRQDELKQQIVDAASLVGKAGELNPSGLISIFATLGSVAFGLDRNYRRKLEAAEAAKAAANDSKENATT